MVEIMVKNSITCKLSPDEVKNNRFNVEKKDIGKFFPDFDKPFKLVFGMTEISAKIKRIESSDKKTKNNFFIEVSQNLNLMIRDKIKIIKLSEDAYELQKI